MPYLPRPWNDWYRQYDKEGKHEALWAGIRNVVRSHRYGGAEDYEATANWVMYKFIVFAETHREEIDGNLFSDGRLEGTIQTIARNELVTQYRKNRDDLLTQLDTQEDAGNEADARRSGSVDLGRLSRQLREGTPEQALIDKEVDGELKENLRRGFTERQRYIFARYWDFDGDGSDTDAQTLAAELGMSIAGFHREVKRMKAIIDRVCVNASMSRSGYRV
jgi:hypothetical protein